MHLDVPVGERTGSLHDGRYCTQALRLSEDAACSRIETARACRRFPAILDLLAEGSLSLTTVRILRRHLTEENHEAVLAKVKERSRQEVDALVARLAPQPDVPASVRRLPTVAVTALVLSSQPWPPRVRAGLSVPGTDKVHKSTTRSRHIPREVKRAVWQRDGGECAFVSAGGRRCGERAFHGVPPRASVREAGRSDLRQRSRCAADATTRYESDLDLRPARRFGRARAVASRLSRPGHDGLKAVDRGSSESWMPGCETTAPVGPRGRRTPARRPSAAAPGTRRRWRRVEADAACVLLQEAAQVDGRRQDAVALLLDVLEEPHADLAGRGDLAQAHAVRLPEPRAARRPSPADQPLATARGAAGGSDPAGAGGGISRRGWGPSARRTPRLRS